MPLPPSRVPPKARNTGQARFPARFGVPRNGTKKPNRVLAHQHYRDAPCVEIQRCGLQLSRPFSYSVTYTDALSRNLVSRTFALANGHLFTCKPTMKKGRQGFWQLTVYGAPNTRFQICTKRWLKPTRSSCWSGVWYEDDVHDS